MSERDTDPMDKAYAEAETMLDDAAARAARRARVLAAVAQTEPEVAPAPRPSWRRHGGWLAAASVAGVSLLVAIQINQPPVIDRPTDPPASAAPSAQPPLAEEPTLAAPPAADEGPPARLAPQAPAAQADAAADPVREAAKRAAPALDARIAPREVESVPPPAPLPAPPPPPPPPPPSAAAAPAMGRLARPPAQSRAPAPATAGNSEINELVVTGSRRESRTTPEAMGQRLRDAAAEGRSREISVLLSRETPIDALDDDGETALMKAVQARQLDAVALLRRRGASLDLKNHAGRSVRDMAAALADPEIDKALGIGR